MDTLTAVGKRRSIRAFQPRSIPAEILQAILEAGIHAPSAGNLQPWHFLVVFNQELRQTLATMAGDPFIAQPPVIIVACTEAQRSAAIYGERGRSLYCLQDVAAAVQNMLLAATAHGLGTCWVGAFSEEQVALALGISSSRRPVALIPLGYPAEQPRVPPRRPLEEVCTYVE